MKRYPDTITITQDPEPEQGENGNFSIPDGETIFSSDCRFQPAGGNNTIKGDDGQELNYSYKVYMPKTESIFYFGDQVTGTTHSGFTISSTVKRYFVRQNHSEVWV